MPIAQQVSQDTTLFEKPSIQDFNNHMELVTLALHKFDNKLAATIELFFF